MQILYDRIILEINGHFGDIWDRAHLYANDFEIVHDNVECSTDKIEGLVFKSSEVLVCYNNLNILL